MTEVQRKATLRDGQDAGEMLLDIEARIGELIKATPKPTIRAASGKMAGSEKSLPEGITEKGSRSARTIADNPAIVAKIKAQARANEDIPTKTAVLNAFLYEREQTSQEAASIRE